MAEIRTVTTLSAKRDEIVSSIKHYEKKLEQAKADLSHILATIRIFEVSGGDPESIPNYMDLTRLFRHGEAWKLCKAALEANGAMTTKELASDLMRVKGLASGDKVLERGLGQKLVNSLLKQQLRGKVTRVGKRKGVIIWRLPAP
jgi:hypothetical protein